MTRYGATFLLILGLCLLGVACLSFRKPGVSFAEVALRTIWFVDPNIRLRRPGVFIQWSGLICIIGAGLLVLFQQ